MPSVRKDLSNFHGLPRTSFWSHLRRHAHAQTPRKPGGAMTPEDYALLAAFRGHWWKWLSDYVVNRFGKPHPYADYRSTGPDVGVYRMPAEVVIDLAGDWGTGTDEAEQIGARMRADHPDYTIHLGDIYYVGDAAETRENFLGAPGEGSRFAPCAWPLGSRGSFALLGNHEMYSRGVAYFKYLLPALGPIESGRPAGQKASFFCLENDDWRLIGLDTGYNSQGAPLLEYFRPGDCALRPELMDWLSSVVALHDDDRRGLILLSHHQYYSRFDEWAPKPAQQLAALIKRPVLWFWGHEHRLAVYRGLSVEGGLTAYGRCLGHGGMPVDLPPARVRHPECNLEFVDERVYPNAERLNVGYNGYARLRLSGKTLRVDYVDIKGEVLFAEVWTIEKGQLRRAEVDQSAAAIGA